jgi:hypothetical protein
VTGANQASSAVAEVGKSGAKAGKQAGAGWKGMAKWAGGAAVLYGAQRYIRGAVSATEDLAKSTLALQRQTNLDTKSASEWVGVLKERGIQTKTFQVGLKTLSKQMEASRLGTAGESVEMRKLHREYAQVAAEGGKKAPAALVKLAKQMQSVEAKGAKSRGMLAKYHISLKAISSGNTKEVLYELADALKGIKNPAERSTLAQTMLGRSGISLLPVLMKGRKGIEEMLGVQERYGNYIDGKGGKSAAKLIEQQRELHAAMEGARVQLGIALLPVLMQVSGWLVKLARIMAPLTKNAWGLKIVIGVLALAFTAYKIGCVAATIASWGLTAAEWALLGVWILVIVAIAALVIGIYVLYKKWKWFHNFVQEAWKWIKANWPLLAGIILGPFAYAAIEIVKHFGAIKDFVLGVVNAIKKAFTDLFNYAKALPGKLKGAALGVVPKPLRGAAGAATKAGGWLASKLAAGGTVQRAGSAIVGDAGPELLHLPIGARVTPLVGGQTALAGGMPNGGGDIIIPVYLDGREITRSVARWTDAKLARR